VPLLVQNFCDELGGDIGVLPQDVKLSWEEHSWPGNIRELRNTVARHLALGELANLDLFYSSHNTKEEDPEDIIEEVLALPLGEARARVVEQFERRYVERMLARHGGNVTRAAESAGVARRYFQIIKARAIKKAHGGDGAT
jgi:DNA-binding NtrC family response regulator